MKIVQNEKGYTLLLTLIIIFIIIIFFSSFALSAMNQQKQVENTDNNYQAVGVAEMGIEYYQAEIVNQIYKIKSDLDAEIERIEDNHNLSASEKASVISSLELEFSSKLRTGLECIDDYKDTSRCHDTEKNDILPVKEIDTTNSVKFTLLNSKILSSSTKPQLEILVEGSVPNKQNKISAIFNIPETLLTVTFIPGNGPGTGNPIPEVYPDCNNDYIDNECKVDGDVLFSSDFTFSGGTVQFNDTVTITKKTLVTSTI